MSTEHTDEFDQCPVWVPQGSTPNADRERCTVEGPHMHHRAHEPAAADPVVAERVRRALAGSTEKVTMRVFNAEALDCNGVWRCPSCPWSHAAHPVYDWSEQDTHAVEVHQTMLCPATSGGENDA